MDLRQYLPTEVAWSTGKIVDLQGYLFDVEKSFIGPAVKKRRQEFRAGRTCARNALKSLARPEEPIVIRPDRSPYWPVGTVGSITHSNSWAAAIVGDSHTFLGLGIDITESQVLDRKFHHIILTDYERRKFCRQLISNSELLDMACVIFAIKEAIFKAVFPVTGIMFDFLDATVDFSLDLKRYRAVIDSSYSSDRLRSNIIEGSIGYAEQHVIATAVIPR